MKYATGGNGSALQQPGILQRFLPEALVCASQYSPAEGKNSNSRRHLHASETQLNFLRRWGDRINQLLGRRVDAVRERSENEVAAFLSGNWAAGRLSQFSQREKLL